MIYLILLAIVTPPSIYKLFSLFHHQTHTSTIIHNLSKWRKLPDPTKSLN